MSVIKNVIRGGQTNLHGVRMSIQIVRSALLASMMIGMLCFCVQCYSAIPSSAWGQYFEFQVAKMTQSIVPDEVQIKKTEQLYYPVRGKPYKRKILSIINDSSLRLISRLLEKSLESLVIESSKVSLGIFVLIILFWGLKGYIGKQKKHKRGIEIVELSKLKWRLRLNQLASDIKLGSLPLVKNSETSHILIAGTTGAGKSNCFNLLFSQVRKKGQKSIIYDPTGEYVAKFYRKDKDKLLNPFDARSENWNIWSEFSMQYELEKIASALIPDSKANDPFWIESARALFVYGALDFYENKRTSSRDFVAEILGEDSDRLRSKLSNTPIAPMLDKENNKQLLSVKSTLMTYIRCFEYLEDIDKDKKSFSISKWIAKEDDSCLFITCKPSQRKALLPLISTWMDISISALMDLSPCSDRRCWFFIDELPALQKLPSLRMALAESRKYGGCIVAGMQSLNQMSEIYGHESAKAMLNMFNTEIYFRMIESSNRDLISKALGDAEETEYLENISYGANTMRDGVSAYSQTRMKRLVTSSELRDLEDLEAFVRLPKVEAITRFKMPYASIKNIARPFRDKTIKLDRRASMQKEVKVVLDRAKAKISAKDYDFEKVEQEI